MPCALHEVFLPFQASYAHFLFMDVFRVFESSDMVRLRSLALSVKDLILGTTRNIGAKGKNCHAESESQDFLTSSRRLITRTGI